MRKEDFAVGKDAYVVYIGSGARFHEITKAVVTKIGKRYIYARKHDCSYELSFNMHENFIQHTQYSPDYRLFASEEAAKEHIDRMDLISSLNKERLYQVLNLLTYEELVTIKGIFENAKARKENSCE